MQIQEKVSNAYSILRLNFAKVNDSEASSNADAIAGMYVPLFSTLCWFQMFVFFSFFVIVVGMSPSGRAYMGRQMLRRDEEFHQIHIVPKYIFDDIAVTDMKCLGGWTKWAHDAFCYSKASSEINIVSYLLVFLMYLLN